MALVPPKSIISGVEYAVETVNGARPSADADFAGDVVLALAYDPPGSDVRHEQEICGLGRLSEGGIYVNEKDERGKDLRRWQVRPHGQQGYCAVQGLF